MSTYLSVIDTLVEMSKRITQDQGLLLQFAIFGLVGIFLILFLSSLLFFRKPESIYKALTEKENRIKIVAILGCAFLIIFYNLYFWNFITDDAFITFRYALNLSRGNFIVFNVDGDPVEGYSNFLWVLISAFALYLGLDIVVFIKVFGIVCSLSTMFVLYSFTKKFVDEKRALIAPILYAVFYPIHLWTTGGLETPLFILLLLTGSMLAFQEQQSSKKIGLSCIPFFLLSITRPEGIIYYLAIEALIIFKRFILDRDKAVLFQRLFTGIIGAGSYTIYFAWRYFYYGQFFPNSYYAKGSQSIVTLAGVNYLLTFILFSFPIIILALVKLIGTIQDNIKKTDKRKAEKNGEKQDENESENENENDEIVNSETMAKKDHPFILFIKNVYPILFILVPIAVNFAIILNLKAFNAAQGFRFALPAVPFIIILAVMGFDKLKGYPFKLLKKLAPQNNSNGSQNGKFKKFLYQQVPALMIICLVIYPISTPIVTKNVNNVDVNEKYMKMGLWLKENCPENTTIAFSDMGIIPFYSELRYIDMWGLMDEHIARNGFSTDYVLNQNPELIILKTAQDYFPFDKDPNFQANYTIFFTLELKETTQYLEEYTYHLMIYKRNDFVLSNATLVELYNQ